LCFASPHFRRRLWHPQSGISSPTGRALPFDRRNKLGFGECFGVLNFLRSLFYGFWTYSQTVNLLSHHLLSAFPVTSSDGNLEPAVGQDEEHGERTGEEAVRFDQNSGQQNAIQGDLGYIGITQALPGAILPHNSRSGSRLTRREKRENRSIGHNPVLIENDFERWKRLFPVFPNRDRSSLPLLKKSYPLRSVLQTYIFSSIR
jgi:hypothetical protein